jgi:hypothetical protein
MTATIKPPSDVYGLERKDPLIRMNDYCEALRFYLSIPNDCYDRIFFIENTNSDLSPLQRITESFQHEKIVEFITFSGNNFPSIYGRGYGEFKLIDYGLEHAKYLKEEDIFWKVTGRLKILNIQQLIKSAPRDYDIYCDLRKLPLWITNIGHHYKRLHTYPWADLRVYSCRIKTYDQIFRGRYAELRYEITKKDAEKIVYDILWRSMNNANIVPRFKIQPRFSGFCGFKNESYDSGIEWQRNMIRNIMRKVYPWLWL